MTSAIAGPAYAGIPVTHRSHASQVTIFTGHEDPTKPESSLDYAKIAQADGTKVMLMGVERIAEIAEKLVAHGAKPGTPIALTRWATTGRQQTVEGTLATIAQIVQEKDFKAPAVCVIGTVVLERDKLNWFENRPLFGKRIVVTRTAPAGGRTYEETLAARRGCHRAAHDPHRAAEEPEGVRPACDGLPHLRLDRLHQPERRGPFL